MKNLSDLLVSYKQVSAPKIDNPEIKPYDRFTTYLNNLITAKERIETATPESSDENNEIQWVYKPLSFTTTQNPTQNPIQPSAQPVRTNLNKKGNLNDNAEYAYNYFINNGLSQAAAAGIVGNLYHENLANPSQTVNDSRGTTALGIAGFNSKGDLPNLQKWCREHGLNETDFDAQLAYLTDVVKSGRVKLNDPNLTPEQASFIFGRDFERFAGRDGTGRGYKNYNDPEHSKRRETALRIYNKYGKNKS